MSKASQARNPKRPTPNRTKREPWQRRPINITEMAKINTEVNSARKQGWRETSGAFGGQSKSLRAARTIRKLIEQGIATPVPS